jgi:PAS domain-containing protein
VSEFLINSVSLNSAQKLTVTADFLNNISTGMIFRDARGVIVDCNQAAELLLGTSREKLLGTTTTEMNRASYTSTAPPLPSTNLGPLRPSSLEHP